MKKTLGLFVVALSFLFASSVFATPLGNFASNIGDGAGSQESLQQIVNNVFGDDYLDVNADQSGVGVWTQDEWNSSALKVTYLGTNGILGIYDYENGQEFLFTAMTSGYTASIDFAIMANGDLVINNELAGTNWSDTFGFFFQDTQYNPGHNYYTEDDKNDYGYNQMASYLLTDGTSYDLSNYSNINPGTFSGNNDYMIAFDVNITDGTGDYQDGVFLIEDIKAVPEPGTLLLLGTGLLGLIAYRRKS